MDCEIFLHTKEEQLEESVSLGLDSESITPGNNEDTHRTAILLLDFQNELVKKGGKLHNCVSKTMEETGLLERIPKLIEVARKMGAMIIYSPVVMKETGKFDDTSETETFEESGELKQTNLGYTELYGLFTENTWNCEIAHEVEPKNDDIVLKDRSNYSAFAGTKLLECLQENHIKQFFVSGFLTDFCVSQTSADAAILLPNMSTYVISDGCAAQSMEDHITALKQIAEASESVRVVSASEAESILVDCAESRKRLEADGDSDQWLMIDKIFAAGGAGRKEEFMNTKKMKRLIGSVRMERRSPILASLDSILQDVKREQVSRASMHRILFKRKPRTAFLEKLPLFIIMVYMPFLYSISTRVPFIFVALEISVGRGRKLWEVGLVLGVYQISRGLGNLIIVMFGGENPFKRLQLMMIFSALFGWSFLTLYDRPSQMALFPFQPDSSSSNSGEILPLFALFGVGLCETIVILQRALMIETAKDSPSGIIDESVLANRFSMQYAFVACGSVVAFILGGWLYTYNGFYLVCDFAIIVQLLHLVGAIVYLIIAKNSKKSLNEADLDGNDEIRSITYRFQAFTVMSKYSQGVVNGSESVSGFESSNGLSSAAIKAKEDRVLNHALGEMFQHYFNNKEDDISCMEKLLVSIDKRETTDKALASKRPLAMAIGKHKLSKLVLFRMKKNGGSDSVLTEGDFISFWAPRVYLSMFESCHETSVTVIWPYMKAVVATQAIAALCIGVFLSTAMLSYTQRFNMDAARVGLFLGIGEACGVVIIFAKSVLPSWFGKKNEPRSSSSNNNKSSILLSIVKAIISRPMNVPGILVFCSLCSMLFSIDNLAFAVVFQIMYSSVNDLSVSLMNELAGTSLPPDKFKYYQGMGQWLRRVGNTITAILGPVFFDIDKRLPFLFFGAIVFVWAFVLWFLMYMHAERIQQSITINSEQEDDEEKSDKKSCVDTMVKPFAPFLETSQTPWHILEQRYYALNKNQIEEELNGQKKTSVDISLMEDQIRCIVVALEVEKGQRRALEDRIYATVSQEEKFEDEMYFM